MPGLLVPRAYDIGHGRNFLTEDAEVSGELGADSERGVAVKRAAQTLTVVMCQLAGMEIEQIEEGMRLS